MRGLVLLAALVAVTAASPEDNWSWGAEVNDAKVSDAPPSHSEPQEQGRSVGGQVFSQDGNVIEIPAGQFQEPLPLEPHSQTKTDIQAGDSNREARFLGISSTLCRFGFDSQCEGDAIKKKGYGYAHTVNSHYGAPALSYNNYPPLSYDHKPKGHKDQKKGSTGVTDLISGFINSYTKPTKPKKGFELAKLPTYIPPSEPVPVYIAQPIFNEPPAIYPPGRPSLQVPQPSYSPPKSSYSPPKSSYGAPIQNSNSYGLPTYVESSYSAPVINENPKYISSPKIGSQFTQPIAPLEPTKVQHIHSHTHVYHGTQVVKPGDVGYDDGYAGHEYDFQKKSDDSKNAGALSGSTSFVSGPSFASGSVFDVPLQGSSSHQFDQVSNPFDAINSGNDNRVNSNGFSSHTKFIKSSSSNHNHQGNHEHSFPSQSNFDGFQPSQYEFGFKPSTTVEDMIYQNHLHKTSRTSYAEDCQCIPEQFCPHDDIVRPYRDLSHIMDARKRRTNVFSNATSVHDTHEIPPIEARSVDFADEGFNATEGPVYYYDLEYDTEIPQAENVTEKIESSRQRRDTNVTEENYSDVQGRQLKGYTPGPNGCGSGNVCCKRPVYSPARSLPLCGISNKETIHGRIKTKTSDNGRAGFAEYPWQAAILRRSGRDMVYVCGGTLINQRDIITAAHCLKDLQPSQLKVRLGEWDVKEKTEFYPYIEFEVSGMYIHEEFYEGNLENDIAVLRLAEPVNYEKYPHVGPVCIPPKNTNFNGHVCTITGWGKDGWGSDGDFQTILKETDVPVLNKELCQEVLRRTKLGSDYKLHPGMMCAGGEENRDACKGDGGGPLVCQGANEEFYLAGVVSWGLECGHRGVPGVYVDIPYYFDWINKVTRS